MPLNVKDASGATVVVAAQGTGTSLDPFVPYHTMIAPSDSAFASLGTGSAGVIKGSPGRLNCISSSNPNLSQVWLMVFDRTTVPPSGGTPLRSWLLPAQSFLVLDQNYFGAGLLCTLGICWAISSSGNLYNSVGGSTYYVDGRFN